MTHSSTANSGTQTLTYLAAMPIRFRNPCWPGGAHTPEQVALIQAPATLRAPAPQSAGLLILALRIVLQHWISEGPPSAKIMHSLACVISPTKPRMSAAPEPFRAAFQGLPFALHRAIRREAKQNSLLHLAARRRDLVAAQEALTVADVDSRDPHGWTALHIAASRGDQPMCRLLLGAGADARLTCQVSVWAAAFTPLSVACSHVRACQPTAIERNREALHLSVRSQRSRRSSEHEQVVRLLLDHLSQKVSADAVQNAALPQRSL